LVGERSLQTHVQRRAKRGAEAARLRFGEAVPLAQDLSREPESIRARLLEAPRRRRAVDAEHGSELVDAEPVVRVEAQERPLLGRQTRQRLLHGAPERLGVALAEQLELGVRGGLSASEQLGLLPRVRAGVLSLR